jgi:hypothetical protein
MVTIVECLVRQVEGDPTGGKCEQSFHGVGVNRDCYVVLSGRELERKELNTSERGWLIQPRSVLIRGLFNQKV